MSLLQRIINQRGRVAYLLLRRLGVPVPVLIAIYVLRVMKTRRT